MTRSEIIERCLDNTKNIEDREEQGMLWFGRHFFPHIIKNKYSMAHFKMSQLYFELLCPQRLSAMDRKGYMLLHREAAKSTISTFLMPLYSIFLKGYRPVYKRMNLGWEGGDGINNYDIVQIPKLDEKFILVASETAGQSESFVMDIKTEIEENRRLKEIFGSKDPIDIDEDDFRKKRSGKWTRTAFITNDKTAVWGVGSGQRVRGRKINGTRPTFIIVDDMYSEENTKTAERREGLNQWFYNALKNSLDSQLGKLLWLGTMVHPDIVYKDFKKDKSWIGLNIPIISNEELSEALSCCTHDENGLLELPDLQETKRLNNKFTTLSWKDRYPIEYILKKYREQIIKERPDYFYQEYMNTPMSPDSETIDPKAFERHSELRFYINENDKQYCKFVDKDNITWEGEVLLRIGVDMASALHKKADDTVITVAGYSRLYPRIPGMGEYLGLSKYPEGIILPILAHIEGGKFDILSLANNGERKDIANILFGLINKFKIDRICIEANGQQEMSIRAIRGFLLDKGSTIPLEAMYVNQEKSQRIKATLLPIFQKYKKMICIDDKAVTILYQQLNMLTISDKDDYPDSLEKALVNARIPSNNYKGMMTDHYQEDKEDIMKTIGKDSWYYL